MKFGMFLMLALCAGLTACGPAVAGSSVKKHGDECVILLHGMGRTHRSMNKMADFLERAGFQTVNFGYPSTRESIETIAADYLPRAFAQCEKFRPRKIHIVTHSLGGIVVRQYLQDHTLPPGSRVVMLSPPNRGSELADYLKCLWIYQWRNGPAGQQLGTDPHSVPNTLKPVDAEIGIITGNRSFNPLFSDLIPGPDDGKVSVARARLDGMRDFLVIPATHTFIMRNRTAMEETLYFLEKGRFTRQASGSGE